MSKDQTIWQISCQIEELKLLNDRIICGDHTSKGALNIAKEWISDLESRIRQSPRVSEAWMSVSITYGGVLSLSWQITYDDKETIRGNVTPVRRS